MRLKYYRPKTKALLRSHLEREHGVKSLAPRILKVDMQRWHDYEHQQRIVNEED